MSDTISFEHFDPELELGNLDENGRPIRPRKKPGRKPNPPSPAQRKAQNRAAQRAFRERKRREMREAESTVKRCMYARDQALCESRRLKRRLDELQFESNYLKGYALTLKMACIANNVEVPKFWDTGVTDELGADELTFSKTKGVPQQMEFFLDKNMNIISIDHHHESNSSNTMSDNELPPSSILSCSSPKSSYLVDDENNGFSSPESSYASDFGSSSSDFDISNTLSSIAPQLASHLQTPFFQQLLNTDLVGTNQFVPSSCSTKDQSSDTSTTTAGSVLSSQEHLEALVEEEDVMIDPKTGLPRTVTEYLPTESDETSSRTSTSSSADKKIFPPMIPLDALRQMRAAKNLDANTRALFTPTELQRSIRHDTRIDVIPGAALRDHMILFQDFYNANDLFEYLAESSVFLGGELGNPDSWFVPSNFFRRYWFLCPNHKRDRMDNAVDILVDLGKHMIQLMTQRKQMYIERELYAEHFPEPTNEEVLQQVVDNVFLQTNDQHYLDDIYLQQQQHFTMEDEDELTNDSILANDLPLDHFMTMINNANLPKMTPHQQFTV